MKDEPRAHRGFLVAVGIAVLGSVPFLFIGRSQHFVFGLPLWLWSSLVFTVALSVITMWGILRFWRDDSLD